jgi:hypothetical protein
VPFPRVPGRPRRAAFVALALAVTVAGPTSLSACGGGGGGRGDREASGRSGSGQAAEGANGAELGEAIGAAARDAAPSTTTSTTAATTTTTAPPTPVALTVSSVSAPSTAPTGVDACQTPTAYDADHLTDGAGDTAWRMAGDATGQTLTLSLGAERRVLRVGLVPGYNKVDPCDGTDRWAQNRRPTLVTWLFDDGTDARQTLADTRDMQTLAVDARTSTIRLRIDGVTPSPERDFTAISEVSVQGT